MASIYDLKPKFQAFLRPLCKGLVEAGVSANGVTITAVILSIVYGGALYLTGAEKWLLILLPLFLFIRMAMNAIDGMLAREFGQKSDLGAILNELSDVVADAALYLPLAFVPGLSALLIVAVVVIGVIAEMAGVIAVMIGASRRYDGPFGKSDRAFLFGLGAFLIGLGVTPGLWSDVALGVAALLGVLTIFNRARTALNERKGDASHG